ncbi:MAG: acetolactate synthase small subunit [Gemmatimonadetes bacterium]|nr:acetolactate synthase small subunit [Gemmatimonadota bacterium]
MNPNGSPPPGPSMPAGAHAERECRILARVRDRPGALERVAGLLRRRAFAVRRFSVAQAEEGILEILLRVQDQRTPPERVESELRCLVDVVEVRRIEDRPTRATRELVLARVRGGVSAAEIDVGRPLPDGEGGTVLEITGPPEEVDAVLRRLAESGVISGFVRSGEIAVPAKPGPCDP